MPVFIRRPFLLIIAACIAISMNTSARVLAEVFTDGTGRRIEITKKPERIVSLAPSITEILFSLQLGNKITGVTDFCDYPEEAARKPKVGWLISPSIEKIVTLQPDIVFATTEGNKPEIVDELERMSIKTYVLNPRNIHDVLGDIIAIGDISGRTSVAAERVRSLKSRIDAVEKRLSDGRKRRVMYIVSTDPIISAGPGSFIHDLIVTAGGLNIMSDSPVRYPHVNIEEIISRDPEIIIAPRDQIEQIKGWKSRWGGISALSDGMVFPINPDIVSRPGPRIIDGLELISDYIHKLSD